MAGKKDLKGLEEAHLAALLEEWGEPPWRTAEIRRWLYRRAVREIGEMTSLPRALRERLSARYRVREPEAAARETAADGTVKLLMRLEDGAACETVLIPRRGGFTQCLSSQSGCAMGCRFCATGARGPGRNLAAGEILDQWLAGRREIPAGARIGNLVFMGMGEPLANFRAVSEALGVFLSPAGGGLSPARVTVSTAGLVPGIRRLGEAFPRIKLAVSLNAPDDALRDELMPVNRRYPLRRLMAALRAYPVGRGRITIEYVLLGGVNDTPAAARATAALLAGLRCRVNLIPFNAHPRLPFRSPQEGDVLRFQEILKAAGYTVLIRASKGGDIAAACGQLGYR